MLLPFEPVKHGVCEEPFASRVYNDAESEYRVAMLEFGCYLKDGCDQSDLYCSKLHFLKSVSLLKFAHSCGEVESIENLPSIKTIMDFDKSKLEKLADILERLYFNDNNLLSS
jgi:hypothetical protein